MTLKELRRLKDKWAARLKINDWDIVMRWADFTNEEDAENAKTCHAWAITLAHSRSAEIVVVHPDNNVLAEVVPRREHDIEVVIVHELLHLPFTPFGTVEGTAEEVVEENLIDMLSRLLVAVDRGDEKLVGRKLPNVASITRVAARKSPKKTRQEATPVANEIKEAS